MIFRNEEREPSFSGEAKKIDGGGCDASGYQLVKATGGRRRTRSVGAAARHDGERSERSGRSFLAADSNSGNIETGTSALEKKYIYILDLMVEKAKLNGEPKRN